MMSDRVDSETFIKFLYQLKRAVGKDKIYVIWDNAGGHVAKRVKRYAEKEGIYLIRQPPWSPHLNPVEEIWTELKIHLANRLFFSVDELKDAIMEFFEIKGYVERINIDGYFSG